MSAPIVQAQYEELEQIAARFAAAAEQQQALQERVNRQVEVLRSGGWQGKGVAAFLREMDGEVGPAEKRLIDGLLQAQGTLFVVISTMRQAENDAASYFRSADLAALEMHSSILGASSVNGVEAPHLTDIPAWNIDITKSIENTVNLLDDLLKPIDWISNSSQATKIFDDSLENIGRLLNDLGDTRGYIKGMKEMGEFLKDAEKSVGFISDVVALKDMGRYFNGEITNAEVARIAFNALIPIPVLDDKIADWAIDNMVDPGGHWQGLVPKVQ